MPAEENDAVLFCLSQNATASEMGDELAVLNFGNDTYYTLNSTGAFLWNQLITPKTFGNLVNAMTESYGVDAAVARQDVKELLDSLVGAGLVKQDVASS